MIAKDTFTVYAQYNEDIILAALLHNVETGFYVDVGANHERLHSVTKYFYDKGWNGINIEPIPRLITEFNKARKRDVNLQVGVSKNKGKLKLRDYPDFDGLSTLSDDSKNEPTKIDLPHIDYEVKVERLDYILTKNNVKKIDFLKIDVEGYEFEVLQSNDWNKFRPTVVCIEANHRLTDWSVFIQKKGYKRVIFDGLNEYYVADESLELFDGFAERAALLSHNALLVHQYNQWTDDIKRIKFLEDFTERQDTLIKATQKELKDIQEKYTMMNKPLNTRLTIALKGLTTDYAKYLYLKVKVRKNKP